MSNKTIWSKIFKILNLKITQKSYSPLNWTTSFECLIMVILSANTTDKMVNKVSSKLFKESPSPSHFLKKFDIETLQEAIKPLGLWRNKSKNILKTCKILEEDFKGEVPSKLNDLLGLPGVGPKTARVVAGLLFGGNYFPTDTHIKRVLRRWRITSFEDPLTITLQIEKELKGKDLMLINRAILRYAREICTARKHIMRNCPICSSLNLAQLHPFEEENKI